MKVGEATRILQGTSKQELHLKAEEATWILTKWRLATKVLETYIPGWWCGRRGYARLRLVLPRSMGAAAKLSNWRGQWTLPYQENNSDGRRWRRLILRRQRAGGEGLAETHAGRLAARRRSFPFFHGQEELNGGLRDDPLRWSMTARATMVRGGVGKQDMASDLVCLSFVRLSLQGKREGGENMKIRACM